MVKMKQIVCNNTVSLLLKMEKRAPKGVILMEEEGGDSQHLEGLFQPIK